MLKKQNNNIKKIAKEFNNLIKKYENIVIFHHINPDGDCLGSEQGLKLWIEKKYPNKKVFSLGSNENLFPFLEWKFNEIPSDEILNNALGIVVDANYLNRLICNEILTNHKIKNIIRIDHHPESDDLNYIWRFVDSSYCSSSEQVCDLIYHIDKKSIDAQIASYLYLGIYTDTGRFFYDYTSQRTHELVGWLFSTRFNFDELHKNLAKRTLQELEFNKDVLNNYQTNKNVIYYFISHSKAKEMKIPENLRNRVDFLANIDGYDIWIFFIENKEGKIRVRLRSNQKNIAQLARKYGGGGHNKAAGALIDSKDLIEQIVEEATKIKD